MMRVSYKARRLRRSRVVYWRRKYEDMVKSVEAPPKPSTEQWKAFDAKVIKDTCSQIFEGCS